MIKSVNTVRIYERDGKELPPTDNSAVDVVSHKINNDLVVLRVDDKVLTVSARDLRAAIDNATNTARF